MNTYGTDRTKPCIECKEYLQVHTLRCKKCAYKYWWKNRSDDLKRRRKLSKQKYKNKNLDKIKADQRKMYWEDWENRKLKRQNRVFTLEQKWKKQKHNARQRNIPFGITVEQAKTLNTNCYYCGTDNLAINGLGLDRIHNSLGYFIDNVLRACGCCNKNRNTSFTVDEFKVMMDALLEYRKTKV